MISAVVPEGQLVGPPAEGLADELVAHADAEHRHLVDERVDRRREVLHRRGVTRAVRQEHPVGIERQDLLGGGVCRHDGHAGDAGEAVEDRRFDPAIDRHDVSTRIALHLVGLGGGHHVDEIAAVGEACLFRGGGQFIDRSGAERTAHRPLFANDAGQAAGVDSADGGNRVVDEIALQALRRAPARLTPRHLAKHHAAAMHDRRLVIVIVGAVIAEVGRGEGDDLAGIGGVADDLLIAAHDGVEDQLARRDAALGFGSEQFALKDRTVGENQVSQAEFGCRMPGASRAAHRRRRGGGGRLARGRGGGCHLYSSVCPYECPALVSRSGSHPISPPHPFSDNEWS